jgi:hypothetical protein
LVLAVGIDWAEDEHLVALGRPVEGVTEVVRVAHTPLRSRRCWSASPRWRLTRPRVRVVLETRHGTLVEQLLHVRAHQHAATARKGDQ